MLDTHETTRVGRPVAGSAAGDATGYAAPRRIAGAPRLRRDPAEDFAEPNWPADLDADAEEAETRTPRRRRKPLRLRGLLRTTSGRVGFGVALLLLIGASGAGVWKARAALLSDPRLAIASPESIQIVGNSHITRGQLLSVFGEDVDRNILTIPLAERRAELERLPWVEHATVMRLLPNRIRVAIVERVPVAFYRDQDGEIGLVDGHGVLLAMPDTEDGAPAPHYSFPVVTGIGEDVPLSTRAPRMRIFERFTAALNASSDRISERLSEVDLSSPEDVKALIPAGKNDILVHFGDQDFLARYQKFEANLPKWQMDYPKLASADMRYPREVVLEMQPGTQVPLAGDGTPETAAPAKAALVAPKPVAPAKPSAAIAKPAAAPPTPAAKVVPAAKNPAKPVSKVAVKAKPVKKPVAPPAQGHLENSFDVPAGKHRTKQAVKR